MKTVTRRKIFISSVVYLSANYFEYIFPEGTKPLPIGKLKSFYQFWWKTEPVKDSASRNTTLGRNNPQSE